MITMLLKGFLTGDDETIMSLKLAVAGRVEGDVKKLISLSMYRKLLNE